MLFSMLNSKDVSKRNLEEDGFVKEEEAAFEDYMAKCQLRLPMLIGQALMALYVRRVASWTQYYQTTDKYTFSDLQESM
jgi:hypothetical protein